MNNEEENPNSIFDQYCQISTCGGVIDCYSAKKKIGKYFWAATIIILLILTVFSLSLVVSEYFNSAKYKTSVWLHPKDEGVRFPDVTICNFNRARKSVLKEIELSNEALIYAFGSFLVIYDVPLNMTDDTIRVEYENSWLEFVDQNSNFNNLSTLFDKIGSDCKSTFWLCRWKTTQIPCCDYVKEVVNAYGKCFVFSIFANDSMQTTPGVAQGLKVIMDPHLEEYSTDLVENNFLEEGFVVNPSYVYEPILPDPVAVGSGTHAWIALSAKTELVDRPRYQVAPLPCRQDTELKILSEPYSKQNCFVDCMLDTVLQSCGCIFLLDSTQGYPMCNASVSKSCVAPAMRYNKKEYIRQANSSIADCTINCIIPCNGIDTISATVTTTKFQWRTTDQDIINFLSSMGFQTDVEKVKPVSLDIYFPQLQVVTIETMENTSVFTFLSNIGGQLGLWLGISVVTCIQFLYYMFLWLLKRAKAYNGNKKIKENVSATKHQLDIT